MGRGAADYTASEVIAAKHLFEMLLLAFGRCANRAAQSASRLPEVFENLLSGYAAALQKAQTRDRDSTVAFTSLLTDYERAVEADRLAQESHASDFNLLDVLQITGRETKHSMVLAWLLDADIRKQGSHAQGNLGFKLFLKALRLPASLAEGRYWVRREVAGDEARVDIEIASRNRFLIHIENKIWAKEGSHQTDREWADMQRRAAALGVSNVNMIHALFLTPTGDPPLHKQFHPISWRQVAHVLEEFSELAKPRDVKLFAGHYASGLRRFVVRNEIRKDSDA